MKRKSVLGACIPALLGGLLAAEPGVAGILSKDDLHVAGYVDGGRFQLADSAVDGEILNRMGARWSIDKEINENWTASADLHWLFWRNQATDIAAFHIAGLKFDSDMQGFIAYRSGSHRVTAGLWEFKHNPDSKNLGEYLLRTEAYPTIVETSQGKDLMATSFSRVAGFEYSAAYPLFRHQALLYAEQHNVPVNDLNLAWLASVGPAQAELGFGASWHRAIKMGDGMNDDALDPALKAYIKDQGLDTRAVKLDFRGRLDFGAMMEMQDNFRLYGEVAILGLKSDTLYYKDVMQRMPMMAGLDVPTFGILSALSIEVEYFKNPYFDRKYRVQDVGGSKFSPLPAMEDYQNLPNFTKDDWKWSILAHKALNNWLDLKVRFASDHLRLRNWNGDYEGGSPLTQSPKDWYFLARIEYHN